MGSHPVNLAVRFILELAALIIFGFWGWTMADGVLAVVLAIGLPLIAAIVWGTFNVPDDPSRSGKAPVQVPGWLRLLLELLFFGLAVFALYRLDYTTISIVFALIVLIHYVVSYDRIQWLLSKPQKDF